MEDLGPAGPPEGLHGFGQFTQHQGPLSLFGAQQRRESTDGFLQLVTLLEQPTGFECCQPLEWHVEDVVGLDAAEVESFHEPDTGGSRVLGATDDGDDLVNGVQGREEASDQVKAFLGLVQPVAGASDHDVQAVVYVVAAHLLDAECAGLAVHQHDVVDAEGLLQGCQPVELSEDGLRVVAGLHRHLDA